MTAPVRGHLVADRVVLGGAGEHPLVQGFAVDAEPVLDARARRGDVSVQRHRDVDYYLSGHRASTSSRRCIEPRRPCSMPLATIVSRCSTVLTASSLR